MVGNAVLKTKKGVYPVMITQYETSYDKLSSFEGHIVGENIARYVNDLAPATIKKVHFNDPATVVLWSDGTKTVVKCQPGDVYSKETGLALCIAKKFLGNKGNFNDVFKQWIPVEVEISVEEMRLALELFCDNIMSCGNCVLDSCSRCGQGAHFTTKRSDGNYTMFDDEIRAAYRVAFKKEG